MTEMNKRKSGDMTRKIIAIGAVALLLSVIVCALCACQSGLSYFDSGVRLDYVPYDGNMPYGGATLIRSAEQLSSFFEDRSYIATPNIDEIFARFNDYFFEHNALIFVFAALSQDASLSVDRVTLNGGELKVALGYHGALDNVEIAKYVSSLIVVKADDVRDVTSDIVKCETSKK